MIVDLAKRVGAEAAFSVLSVSGPRLVARPNQRGRCAIRSSLILTLPGHPPCSQDSTIMSTTKRPNFLVIVADGMCFIPYYYMRISIAVSHGAC